MDAVLGVVIDPSGAQSGAKVVKRTLEDIKNGANSAGKAVSGWLNNSLKSAAGYIKGMAAAYLSFRAVQSIVGQVIAATIEQEAVSRQLEARLKSTGNAAGLSAEQIKTMASSMQGLTTYGDEAVIAMNNILLTFKDIKGKEFRDANMAILDMSTALGMDLQGAAIMVGKALNAPVTGITAMQRAGIQFTESQKNVIKSLVETGQMAKAQQIILAELSSQFGGSAIAARDTLGGALQSLKNTWGDLFEMDMAGSFGNVKGAIEALNTALRSDAIEKFKATIGDLIANGLMKFTNALEFVANNLEMVSFFIQALIRMKLIGWAMQAVTGLMAMQTAAAGAAGSIKLLGLALTPVGAVGAAVAVASFSVLAINMLKIKEQADITNKAIREVNETLGNADSATLQAALNNVVGSLIDVQKQAAVTRQELAKTLIMGGATGSESAFGNTEAFGKMKALKNAEDQILALDTKKKEITKKLDALDSVKKGGGVSPAAYAGGGAKNKKAGGGGKSAAESEVDKIRSQIKYLNADGAAFLPVLDQWKGKLKPLSDDWQKIVDLQREIKADVMNTRLDKMRDMMQFDNKAGVEFVARLDEMQAGLKRLSPEWKQIEAFKQSISDESWGNAMQGFDDKIKYLGGDLVSVLADVTKLRDETQKIGPDGLVTQKFKDLDDKVKSITETLQSNKAWDFSQGFITADEYASSLRETLNGLTRDTDEYKKVFSDLQSVSSGSATKMIDSLTKQFESGRLGSAGYEEALVGIMERFSEFPLVVQTAMDSLQRFREAEELTVVSTGQQLSTALRDVTKDFKELQGKALLGVVDGFLDAAIAGGDFGESLKKLGQDIVYTVLKMLIMQQIMKMFGAIGGWGGGGSSIGNAYIPISEGFSINATGGAFEHGNKLSKYAKGGVVSSPTTFPMRGGTGLMGEGSNPEGILPLGRLPNGDLGVQTAGGGNGGGAPSVVVNVQNNTGQQVGAEQTQVNYNSKTNELIVGVIIDNISRGGSVAKSIRGLGR